MKVKKTGGDTEQVKRKIIRLFDENVRGKTPDTSSANSRHDGRDGHWLETQMGIAHNAKNSADLWGFEMKNNTGSKTTFGDWSANYYIFKDTNYFPKNKTIINRDRFMTIFGGLSQEHEGRYSWSGKPVPKINHFNSFGQILRVDEAGNIYAIYSFQKDSRLNKSAIVPRSMQKDNLVIAKWEAESLKTKVEKKFNMRGWFKCLKDKKTGAYTQIVFAPTINFDAWIQGVRTGVIYFDSGMHQGNKRPYSQWRADNQYWNSLVTDAY